MKANEHKIFRLEMQLIQIYQMLVVNYNLGLKVGAVSPMNQQIIVVPEYFIPDPWTNMVR